MAFEGHAAEARPLGRWRKPPLAYVVAELGIAPHYGLSSKIAFIQDSLRVDYPRTLEAAELMLPVATIASSIPQSSSAPPQPLWQLLNSNQTCGILVQYRAIALHATAYEDSSHFLKLWSQVLNVIEQAEMGLFVERAGLRYVDLIVPAEQSLPSDYLVPSVHGTEPPPGAQIESRGWGLNYRIHDIGVQIHTATPAPANFLLPPNLNALPLQRSAVMAEAQSRVSNQQPIGWIDTDVSQLVQQPFNAKEIVALYDRLHKTVSTTFKAILSDRAKSEWI